MGLDQSRGPSPSSAEARDVDLGALGCDKLRRGRYLVREMCHDTVGARDRGERDAEDGAAEVWGSVRKYVQSHHRRKCGESTWMDLSNRQDQARPGKGTPAYGSWPGWCTGVVAEAKEAVLPNSNPASLRTQFYPAAPGPINWSLIIFRPPPRSPHLPLPTTTAPAITTGPCPLQEAPRAR